LYRQRDVLEISVGQFPVEFAMLRELEQTSGGLQPQM
jgi:hypothetical protein